MITYKIIDSELHGQMLSKIDEDGVEWFIPIDPANSDYQAYLEHEATAK
jgi:hypothetical protein